MQPILQELLLSIVADVISGLLLLGISKWLDRE